MDAMLDRHLSTDATVTDHLSPGSQLDCSASAKSAKSQARKNSLSSKSRLNPEVSGAVSSKWAKGTGGPSGDECYNLVAHPLRGDGFDASEDGTGRGTPLIAAALKANSGRNKIESQYLAIRTAQTSVNGHGVAEDVAHTLDGAQGQAVCFHENQRAEVTLNDTAGSLKVGGGKPGQGYPAVQSGMAVRRLTPRECERLQGLPDDFTLVPFNGKTASDGPRYKAIGNGMAMPVLRWIGERIAAVEGAL
jgi:DNA (cytosine-5)-methyltransferase 1